MLAARIDSGEQTMKPNLGFLLPTLRRCQRGQSTIEYMVVCVALAVALFVPVPGTQPPQAAGELLAGKIHDLYRSLTFFLSLP
jgi:hypothetical protein